MKEQPFHWGSKNHQECKEQIIKDIKDTSRQEVFFLKYVSWILDVRFFNSIYLSIYLSIKLYTYNTYMFLHQEPLPAYSAGSKRFQVSDWHQHMSGQRQNITQHDCNCWTHFSWIFDMHFRDMFQKHACCTSLWESNTFCSIFLF